VNRHLTTATSIASQVARAADEFLEQLGRGESPDVLDFAQRYPQIASVLPEVLPVLQVIQALAPSDQEPPEAPSKISVLGEFRLLREIGRGGMGVVYEAEQISLGRQVALKVLPMPSGLDSKQLARFQIEAQVAAALHHPHIVPIFAVGCDRGIHYYAMQLIEGRCLADILRNPGNSGKKKEAAASVPLPPREAARLAMQAAEALEHAHNLGVLHRDIKPANLLRDDRGHLWVTDFGLARFQEGDDLTKSGDVLGTLRYMSPEQAAGGRVLDPRTDLYSLGATLYELLTAQPAFNGHDRQEIHHQIAVVEPVPPRKLDPNIPRDLETIVGKAMAKEPERRYATAQDLADDLRRFLDDRPILARRPNFAERIARWSRRHRRATAAAAALSVLLALASAGGMALLWKEQRQTQAALEKAKEARDRERQALIFTFTASDQITSRALAMIAEPTPSHSPAEADQGKEFCRKALKYYQEIAARYDGDPEMLAIAAAASHRVGFIRTILKDARAEDALRRSIALYERLVADAPGAHDLRSALAFVYGDLELLLRTTDRSAAIVDCLRRLVALRQGLADDFPAEKDNLICVTYLQIQLTAQLEAAGQSIEAEQVRRQLRESSAPSLEAKPDDHRLRNNLAWLLASRADASALDATWAVKLAKEATALAPQTGDYWNTVGVAHYRAGDWKVAATSIERSMQLRSGGDAYDWLFLAMSRWRLGDPVEARRWYDRSVKWIAAKAPRNQELLGFRAEATRLIR
jgi:serine/threonine protein kinase